MNIADQFALALEFMLLGMGVVFTFLAVLVLVVKLTGAVVQKIEPADASAVMHPAAIRANATAVPDETLTAVISAAVHQYRSEFSRKHS